MPVVTCPECGYEQIVHRDLIGLTANCKSCHEEFRVGPNSARRVYRPASSDDDGSDEYPAVRPRRRCGNPLIGLGDLLEGLIAILLAMFLLQGRGTKRPHNYCQRCGHSWYPRGRNYSRQCPACGSGR